jgi:hypothetical protein
MQNIFERWKKSNNFVKQNLCLINQILQFYPISSDFVHFFETLIQFGESDFDSKLGKICAKLHEFNCLVEIILNCIEISPLRLKAFAIAIMAFISVAPEKFRALSVSQSLIDLALELILNDLSSPIRLCDLISFIIQIDETVDCSKILEFSADFPKFPQLMLGFAGILAAVFYSKKMSGNVEIVLAVIQNGWAVRAYDKDLLMIGLMAVGEFEEEWREWCGLKVRELWGEKERQMDRNEEDLELPVALEKLRDYAFLAPIQQLEVSIETIIGRGEEEQ